jgi:hypothetical protein
MPATAPRDDDAVELRSKVGSTGQSDTTDAGPSASRTPSLSVMHQAFGGLLAHSARWHSTSTEQPSDGERSREESPRTDRVPNTFGEERYSYDSVRESDGDGFALQKRNVRSASGTGSTEFFDYLIAIGGV